MAFIKIGVDINDENIQKKIDMLIDDTVMYEIHNLLLKMCDPYVPFLEGPLSQTAEVTPQSVRYIQPYARYQYYGVNFNHTIDYHPQATALWDKVMMSERGEEFKAGVREILRRRARELYG